MKLRSLKKHGPALGLLLAYLVLRPGAGWRKLATGSLLAPILVHFGFNLGFFLASRI